MTSLNRIEKMTINSFIDWPNRFDQVLDYIPDEFEEMFEKYIC